MMKYLYSPKVSLHVQCNRATHFFFGFFASGFAADFDGSLRFTSDLADVGAFFSGAEAVFFFSGAAAVFFLSSTFLSSTGFFSTGFFLSSTFLAVAVFGASVFFTSTFFDSFLSLSEEIELFDSRIDDVRVRRRSFSSRLRCASNLAYSASASFRDSIRCFLTARRCLLR